MKLKPETQFSRLLSRAHTDEEIIVAPVVKRTPGIARGAVTDAFFEPLPQAELEQWEK